LARARALVGRAEWHAGRAAAAEEALERALGHAEEAGDSRAESEALAMLGANLAQGPRPVEDAARRAEAILEEKRGKRTIEAYMLHALAHLRAWQGRFDEGREFAHEYSAILLENGQRVSWAESLEAAADVERSAGNFAEAARILMQGQAEMEEMGVADKTMLPFLAAALYMEGRDQEAEAAAVPAREAEHPLWGTAVLGKIRARQGRGEEGERLAREAVDTFEPTDFLVFRGRALMDLAEVLRIRGRSEEAVPILERAVDVFERKGAVALADQARSALRAVTTDS
jgi:tetratricopeptide (TPR) repeat protein